MCIDHVDFGGLWFDSHVRTKQENIRRLPLSNLYNQLIDNQLIRGG